MKVIQNCVLLLMFAMVIDSCTKNETKTSAAETQGILLAGTTGTSKSWKIFSVAQSVNGGPAQTITAANIPTCEADNVFQFSNNPAQSYTNSEGASVCTTGDPSSIEAGSWALTDDGKTLLIDASVNVTSTEISSTDHEFLGYMLLAEGLPLSVTQLTATSLTVAYTFTDSSGASPATYAITLVFAKI
jgi:hypothetical protein